MVIGVATYNNMFINLPLFADRDIFTKMTNDSTGGDKINKFISLVLLLIRNKFIYDIKLAKLIYSASNLINLSFNCRENLHDLAFAISDKNN